MRLASLSSLVLFLCCALVSIGAEQGSVIFSDNFSKLDPGWGGFEELSVSGNKLIVNLEPDVLYEYFYQTTQFDLTSADIRVKVAELAGETDQTAGLIFWAVDADNYYSLLVEADGSVVVQRKTEGEWVFPVTPQRRGELNKGLGQTNELRVVTSGRSASIFINGKPIANFMGYPPKGESGIGLVTESGSASARWAFSELRVHKGAPPAAAAAPEDDKLLFADNFATLDPGWYIGRASQSIRGHRLMLVPNRNDSATLQYGGRLFEDADIRVKLSEIKGGTGCLGGILFWGSSLKNHFAACISTDGNFYVAQKVDGKWETVVPKKPCDAVRTGPREVNELRVVTRQDSATFYVNGKQAGKSDGYKHPEHSHIGLRVDANETASIWSVSDLMVRKPE